MTMLGRIHYCNTFRCNDIITYSQEIVKKKNYFLT